MSQKLKPLDGEPLTIFLIDRFSKFARSWKPAKDLERIAVSFSPNGFPTVGNAELLTELLAAAFHPALADSGHGEWLLKAYGRSPDFVLALLTYLRKEIGRLTPHRRHILFVDKSSGPKEISRALKVIVGQGTIKRDRAEIRKMIDLTNRRHSDCKAELEKAFWKQAAAAERLKKSKKYKQRQNSMFDSER